MRRHAQDVVFVELNAEEAEWLDRMCGGLSRPNLVRTALWSLADEMGMNPPNGIFESRIKTGRPKTGTVKAIKRESAPRIVRRMKQSKTHPWAQAEAASWAERKAKESA